MKTESRLIPILREGVDVIKMVFFKKLTTTLAQKYPEHDAKYINMLAGAVINDLFQTPNPHEPFARFARDHRRMISREVASIADDYAEMLSPLTDALRIHVMCNHQEGIESTHVLSRAKKAGILLEDREMPLPGSFIEFVRKLGSSLRLLDIPQVSTGESDPMRGDSTGRDTPT